MVGQMQMERTRRRTADYVPQVDDFVGGRVPLAPVGFGQDDFSRASVHSEEHAPDVFAADPVVDGKADDVPFVFTRIITQIWSLWQVHLN